MSRELINTGNRRPNYGATEGTPDVSFAGFSPTEFYNLCENITTNIYTITSSWNNLKKALDILGTAQDSEAFRNNLHVSQLSTNQILATTTKDVVRLNMIVRKGDKQQKLQVDKLSGDFKEAVGKYSSFQQKVVEKMKANSQIYKKVYQQDEDLENIDADDEEANIRKAQQMEIVERYERQFLQEMNVRITQIESDVIDVNEIMKELSTLVVQQGEVIDTIENCIETATGNIEQGTSELQKAAQYQNKFRRKLCILVIIGITIVSILIAILVTTIKR